jgi:hypothetical protein
VALDHWYLPCLCGYAATTLHASKKHRRDCSIWVSRDKVAVRSERWRRTYENGNRAVQFCSECKGRAGQHWRGCSRFKAPELARPVPEGFDPKDWAVILKVLERKMRGKYQG